MYFADDSMQGMDMHPIATTTHAHTVTPSGLESPAVAFPIVTLAAVAVMLAAYWLLKRFTSWQFPNNKKGL